MDALKSVMHVAGSGMRAQSERLRVISENVANADSTAETPGGDPYRRKTVSFQTVLDRQTGAERVEVARVGRDPSKFDLKYDPTHPAADGRGYVKMPNVSTLTEMADMREASRAYQANMTLMENGISMIAKTTDLLR